MAIRKNKKRIDPRYFLAETTYRDLEEQENYVPREPYKKPDGAWAIPWRAPGDVEEFVTTLKLVGAQEANPGGDTTADPASPMIEVHMEINGQKEEFMAETPRELFDSVVDHIENLQTPANNYWFVNTEHGTPFKEQIEKVIAAMDVDFLGPYEAGLRRQARSMEQ